MNKYIKRGFYMRLGYAVIPTLIGFVLAAGFFIALAGLVTLILISE